MSIVTPTDEELVSALKQLRANHPTLGRDKVFERAPVKNGWKLSEERLKTCMNSNGLKAQMNAPKVHYRFFSYIRPYL
jgi:hypothetical protein